MPGGTPGDPQAHLERGRGRGVTQPPEGRHQVHEGGSPVAEHAGAAVAELVAQGEQVVGDVHAVVVVDGSQLGQLLQVLPGPARREKEKWVYLELVVLKKCSCLS